jgi:hypothetical protein
MIKHELEPACELFLHDMSQYVIIRVFLKKQIFKVRFKLI